jgi:hypothetical protein
MILAHIPFRQLTDYAYNRLQDHQLRQQIRAHVSECAQCRQALTIAWQIAQAASHSTVQEPADALVDRVIKATHRKQQLQAGQRALTQIAPTLLHDSKVTAVTTGMRGGAKERELLFTFGRFDLHLSIVHSDPADSYTLWGQLLVGEPIEVELEGNQIDLLEEALLVRTVLTDQLGCFRISNVKSGTYGLRVATATVESVVQSLALHN